MWDDSGAGSFKYAVVFVDQSFPCFLLLPASLFCSKLEDLTSRGCQVLVAPAGSAHRSLVDSISLGSPFLFLSLQTAAGAPAAVGQVRVRRSSRGLAMLWKNDYMPYMSTWLFT